MLGVLTHPAEVTAKAWWCPAAPIMHTQLLWFASPGDLFPWLYSIVCSTMLTWPKLI